MKPFFKRSIALLCALSISLPSMPLGVHAQSQKSQDEPESTSLSFEEFAAAVSAMDSFSGQNSFCGEFSVENSGEIYIDGQLAQSGDYAEAVVENGVLMADASLFKALDDSVEVEITEQNVIISGESGEVCLDRDECSAQDAQLVPLTLVSSNLGYETVCTDNSVTVSNPFESARLIVKSSGDIDTQNAIDAVCGYMGFSILQFETPLDAYNAYLTYSASDNVELVSPSQARCVDIQEVQEAAYSVADGEHLSWGAKAMAVDGFNSTLEQLGKDENEVIVAVIDTGVDLDHEALCDRIIDSGADFSRSYSGCADDDQGHGTHVAGIVCDLTLDNVKILPVKVLDSSGKGYDDDILMGIIYAIECGADVLNISIGGYGHGDIYEEIFEYAEEQGVVVCVAAGNEAVDAYRTVPACCDGVITVAALADEESAAAYSNFGQTVEFAAPGSNILSTYIDNSYAYLSGTSMASPHASAAAAMLKSYDISLTSAQITDILASSAIDLGDTGRDEVFGFGAICFDKIEVFDAKCNECQASLQGGEYDGAISVALACEDENAEIYYTLDSSEPTKENGLLYTNAIEISHSAVLKAKVYCNGKYASDTSSFKYIISDADSENCYTVENGTIVAYNGILSEVVVPSSYNGQEIIALGESAFAQNQSITSVSLPSSVTEIGKSAFKGCTQLESVKASGVSDIESDAFYECAALREIDVKNAKNIGDYAFYRCKSLEEIDCRYAESIGEYAFAECEALKFANLKSISKVSDYAFCNCKSLYDCRLDYVNTVCIGNYAFYMCSALENEILCPVLQALGDYAFYGCKQLQTVYLGENVFEIGKEAFSGCRNLYYFGAPNCGFKSGALSFCGEVLTDISDSAAESLEADEATQAVSLLPYSQNNAQTTTKTVSEQELCISQLRAKIAFEAPENGEYYIEISGGVLSQLEILSEDSSLVSAELCENGNLYCVYKAQLVGNKVYSITADSKSPQAFSLMISREYGELRQDISSLEAKFCGQEQSVVFENAELKLGVDYEIYSTEHGVTVFAKGDFKGALRLCTGDTDSLELGQSVELYSQFGGDEFVFVPQETQTYYFYALYSQQRLAEVAENGTNLTAFGKISDSNGQVLYTSTTCLQGDCYSYTFFYIEAYLEKGQTYYLSSSANKAGCYSIRITDNIKLLFDTYIEMPSTLLATGSGVLPDITVYDISDYSELVCGEDYIVYVTDNVNPGSAQVYIYGLGDYFGVANRSFTINYTECETTALPLDTTITFDIESGGYAAASINIEEEGSYRISFGDVSVKSYIRNADIGFSNQSFGTTISTSLKQGEYVIVFYPADENVTEVSIKVQRLYKISDATVYVKDLEYVAGTAQIPDVTVRYGSSLLKEGVDYELSFVGNSSLPGVHYFGIKGLGVYTGSATGSYKVECPIKTSSATAISQGEHTVNIKNAGECKLYKFVSNDDASYLLSTSETANVALVVFDKSGNTVSANSSAMGFGTEISMSSGDVMYIAAMYYDAAKTGSWTFEITSDYVLLENVSATYDECVELASLGKTLPQVSFFDGDYTLEYGVDYEYFYASNCTNYGNATVCYKGLGKYKFNKYIDYVIVMPIDELYSSAQALKENVPALYDGDYYSCGVYSFTASENAYYYLCQLEVIDMSFAQFYDENGTLIKKIGTGGGSDFKTRFFLKENETIYMLIGYYSCQNADLYTSYLVKAMLMTRVKSYDYTENDITYTVFPSLSYAVVSHADKDIVNVTLLDTIDEEYPVTQINSLAFSGCDELERLVVSQNVEEIGAFAFDKAVAKAIFLPDSVKIIGYRAFDDCRISKLCIFSCDATLTANSISAYNTVYGYKDASAQEYCSENGVEYVVLSSLLGDLNNDGTVNSVDAAISTRCALRQIDVDPDMNGDVNGDGEYNSLDAAIITRYVLKVYEKFPVQE